MPEHAATERHLAETGTPFTSLRNGFYATTPTLGAPDGVRAGQRYQRVSVKQGLRRPQGD
jgi:NAD(P)H dehydrogenase (quinone)